MASRVEDKKRVVPIWRQCKQCGSFHRPDQFYGRGVTCRNCLSYRRVINERDSKRQSVTVTARRKWEAIKALDEQVCRICEQIKPLSEFREVRTNKVGYATWDSVCKECTKTLRPGGSVFGHPIEKHGKLCFYDGTQLTVPVKAYALVVCADDCSVCEVKCNVNCVRWPDSICVGCPCLSQESRS